MPQGFDTDAENAKLAAMREKEEEDLVHVLSEKYGFAYTDLTIVPINVDALRLIPEKEAREAEALAFDKNGKHLSLATHSPGNVALAQVEHALEARGFILSRFLVSQRSLERGYERYKELSFAAESHAGVFDIRGDLLGTLKNEVATLSSLRSTLDGILVAKERAHLRAKAPPEARREAVQQQSEDALAHGAYCAASARTDGRFTNACSRRTSCPATRPPSGVMR